MQRDVRNWCHACEACQTRKSAPKRNHAPLQTIKGGYLMQVVAVDIMGLLPESKAGNRYVLVAAMQVIISPSGLKFMPSPTRRLPP